MTWTMHSVITIDGFSVGRVYPESGSWRCQVNGVGTGQHTFDLSDALHKQPRAYWLDKFVERRRTLVQSWDGKSVYAGEITKTHWHAPTKRLTVHHREIRGMFSRLPFGPEHARSDGRAPWGATSPTSLSKPGVALAVLRRGFESPNVRRRLPIDFGPDLPGTEEWSWDWHKFPTIESMLTAVQNSDGGPDIWLEPVWSPTGLQWIPRIGNPRISAGEFDYVYGVPETPVTDFSVTRDATRQATHMWGLGEGVGADTLAAVHESPATPDTPVLDMVQAYKDQSDLNVLRSLTAERGRASAQPTVLHEFKLRIGPTVDPSLIRPGTVLNVMVPEDEWVEGQRFTGRVVSVQGDLGDELTVGVV